MRRALRVARAPTNVASAQGADKPSYNTALLVTSDEPPPTVEITGIECIWSPPTLATGCHFRWALWEAYSASPDLHAKFKGRRKEQQGREWVRGAITEEDR